MRIAYVTAGAAGRICGNCLHDNDLALALRRMGEDVLLLPTYTPIRVEGEDASDSHLFISGPRVFLEQRWAWFRRPRPLVDRLLGWPRLVRLLTRLGSRTDPRVLGELTVSMLEGEQGLQAREIDELARWLRAEFRPDVIHLSNILLVGLARRLREVCGVPVVSGLQAEDAFLDALPEPSGTRARELVRERAAEIDGLLAVSRYYAERMVRDFGLPRERTRVVLPGVPLEGHGTARCREGAGLTVGYLARIAPEKGFENVCDAWERIARDPALPGLRLSAAGYLAPERARWARGLLRRLRGAGLGDRAELLGTVDRRGKLAFLQQIDVLCVPTLEPDPKALYILEALASGVPVVAAAHGAAPEILERTGGGVLCPPGDPSALAGTLRSLLLDAPRRRELGAQGRRAVHEHFGSERMARETLAWWGEVAGRAKSPR